MTRHRCTATLAFCCWVAAAPAANSGDAFLPNDDEVLETLPKAVLAGRNEIATLHEKLSADPENVDLAAAVATLYLDLGKRGGGPRYYGYARAAIAPWRQQVEAPPEVLRVRAKLKENNHEYAAALADIDALLSQAPRDAQAWVERVNLLRVMGQYDRAWAATEQLSEFAEGVARVFCRAPLLAVTGRAAEAAAVIDIALPVTRSQLPDVLPWMLTQQAEIARALGDDDKAEAAYRAGLAIEPDYGYLKRAYADFLLDRDRARDVLAMVGDDLADNGVLLAAAIAARRTGQNELAGQLKRQLSDRFRETRLRGDLPHGRYEARCALELDDDPARALQLALANWEIQKEMRDTRNVLEAALAAGRPDAAAPAVRFLKNAGTQDALLRKLVEKLEAE